MDRRGGERQRRAAFGALRLPADVQRLLRLRRGLHAGLSGPRSIHRPCGASAAMDRRHRLCRQARRRDRQRRHRGHDGAGVGAAGGARDDAAALTQLRGRAAVDRQGRRLAPKAPWRFIRPRARTLEEHVAGPRLLQGVPTSTPIRKVRVDQAGPAPVGPGLRHRHSLQPGTTRGTSDSAWCPTAISSRPSAPSAPA